MKTKRKELKKQNILQLFLTFFIIILIGYIASYKFSRFDLTSEKRYTLSDATKNLLKDLEDVVYIQVYLEGDLPAGFKRLKNETKEMLNEFRIYAKDNVEYEFIDPSANPDKAARNDLYKQLYQKGLTPTPLEIKDDKGKTSQQIIFPGAILIYKGKEIPVELLKNNMGLSSDENLNNSVQAIEYELASALTKAKKEEKRKIAFIDGHGELPAERVASISYMLSDFYKIDRILINQQIHSLDGYTAIIIAKPTLPFDDKDKFIIDQFIMHGGKVLWLVDEVAAEMDSLAHSDKIIANMAQLRIDDMLFKYGVRINPDLLEDLQCAVIPVNVGFTGGEPKYEPKPWYFFPLIASKELHPIVKNIDMIKTEFVSSIDTVGNNPSIKKTILLKTSNNTKAVNAPIRIGLDILRNKPDQRYFNSYEKTVSVLLEGTFESVFLNRLTPDIENSKEINYKEYSKPTKMIIVSDGDIIKNGVVYSKTDTTLLPLGADRWFKQAFYGGNSQFLMNAMNYLCDDSGLLSIRSREVKLRLLDRAKIQDERLKWQLINTILPILFIILFGLIVLYIKKKKYA